LIQLKFSIIQKRWKRSIKATRTSKRGAKTVVFTCPGCMKTFEKNYPDMGVELVHSTQFLTRLGTMKRNLKEAAEKAELDVYEENTFF
jgi:Fe-S oxidoreductase